MSEHPEELGLTDGGMEIPVTQADLESWGRDIFRRMDERMDVVARQLNLRESETHTVAIMASILYGKTSTNCVPIAKNLYIKTRLSLEKDRTIVGQIPKERTCKDG